MNVAIITARGGSKRLPGKNIKEFCGHPLIAWSIKQAQCSKLVDAIIVTTDSQEIFWKAMDYADHKTHVMLRQVWDDDTASNKAFHHAVEHTEQLGLKYDNIIAMFPTSPCRKPEDIDNMIANADYEHINSFFTRPRETHVFKEHGICDYLYSEIRSKQYKYWHLASGTWFAERDIIMQYWEKSFSDCELDELMEDELSIFYPYRVEDWQGFECDYQEWFDINQMIMEKFILKGKGIEVYEEYQRRVK